MITAFLFASAGILGLYLISGALYSIILDPLADVPGPKLCAISRIPYWYAFWKGRDVFWMKALHDRYGPVVRFGPNDVSYATSQAWEDVNGPKVQEKAQEFSIQPVNGVPSMLMQDTMNHSRLRRVFAPAFSERALRQQEPLLRKYVDLMIKKIAEVGAQGQNPVELVQLFNFSNFDIMGEFCYGQSLGLLENNEYSPWVYSIFELLNMMPVVAIIHYYPAIKAIFDRFQPKSVLEARIAHFRHTQERVNARLEMKSTKSDLWNLVLAAKEGKELTLKEMHSNAELFMMAGSETTATALCGCIYLLLTHPDKLRILRKELRGDGPTPPNLTLEYLAEKKFLNAVLKEALRVYPPVPIGSPRIVQHGQQILGKTIPAGTHISVHHYATYRSESNFQNPETFAAERWLKMDPIYARDNTDAHKPFSHGPRNCIGQNMAMHEMRLFLATLITSYDLELCEGSDAWLEQKAFQLWMKKPLMVRARPLGT